MLKKSKSLSDSQLEAIDKLNKYKVGALFMEQGTGKTRTAVELVNSTNCDFVLYVAPYRIINPESGESVKDEVEFWGGFNAECEYIGIETISMSDREYLNAISILKRFKRPFIIIDESIKIKNFEAIRTKRMLSLARLSEYRLILNGTPITRDLLDMWSQMEFLSPKILDMDINQFKYTFCRIKTITKGYKSKSFISGYENVDYFNKLIENYVYRCSLNLDVKANVHNIPYTADGEEYNKIKNSFLNEEKMMFMNNQIFMQMTQLMQQSYMLDKAKVEAVKRLELKGKTIIFCKYIATREFCEKEFPNYLVLSLQKSSFGLNLQEYNNIIYFDKVWDYGLIEQSKKRIYRMGQDKDCNYYFITSNLGLDKLIDKSISNKMGVADYFKKSNIRELIKEL